MFLVFIVLITGCTLIAIHPDGQKAEEHEEVHIHADIKVYINDKAVDFSAPIYQLKSKFVHVEDGIGDAVHIHKEDITVGDFFETLDIKFNETCIIIPIEGTYCNEENKKLSFYVNEIENNKFESYEIRDSDRILTSYGKGNIKKQLESMGSLASRE